MNLNSALHGSAVCNYCEGGGGAKNVFLHHPQTKISRSRDSFVDAFIPITGLGEKLSDEYLKLGTVMNIVLMGGACCATTTTTTLAARC